MNGSSDSSASGGLRQPFGAAGPHPLQCRPYEVSMTVPRLTTALSGPLPDLKEGIEVHEVMVQEGIYSFETVNSSHFSAMPADN
jgi:hypothetical protein